MLGRALSSAAARGRKYEYLTMDVFTTKLFGGNPLAIVPDAVDLTTDEMQYIAREFNYSETAFILPAKDKRHTAHVRIFTTQSEVPFAGHPTIGTSIFLAERLGLHTLDLEEMAGLVRVTLEKDQTNNVRASLRAPNPLKLGRTYDPTEVAKACGLPATAILTTRTQPVLASVGLPFVLAEVESRDALRRAKPNLDAFNTYILDPADPSGTGRSALMLFTQHGITEPGIDLATRMFAPAHDCIEDPATGSASAALIGLLAATHTESNIDLDLTFGQGIDMGRSSFIHGRATKRSGCIESIHIAGSAISFMSGSFLLPSSL